MQIFRFFCRCIETIVLIFLVGGLILNDSKKLKKKELIFCHQYLKTGNPKEAAILSGYGCTPEAKAMWLLSRPDICQKIDELYSEKKRNFIYRAAIGYERLAFGSISDAIRLIFSEKLNFSEIEKMNLFNIAEIKKPRDGALEIKFFDRLRALEKLEQIDTQENSGKNIQFYAALENSIQKLNKNFQNQENS